MSLIRGEIDDLSPLDAKQSLKLALAHQGEMTIRAEPPIRDQQIPGLKFGVELRGRGDVVRAQGIDQEFEQQPGSGVEQWVKPNKGT